MRCTLTSRHIAKLFDRRHFLKDALLVGAGACTACSAAEATLLSSSALADTTSLLSANISIDVGEIRHRINQNIYGSFIEDIGRIIYGGVYEEASTLSDDQGFREDVLDAVRDWGVPVLRWPGGNFASGYHWQDGIGPKESRPRRYDLAWFAEKSNHFGTDEFVEYCRKANAEPYICVNLGTGSIEEAANWVEYCNGTGNTSYANLRRKYGHDEPHRVRYWGLGNEVFGDWQIGHKDAEDYAKVALECGKLMKWVDPTIQLVACGLPNLEWNRVILEKLVNIADYVSLHDYEGSDDYYEELGTVQRLEQNLRLTAEAIDLTDSLRGKPNILDQSVPGTKTKKRIEIACDEWNIWYRKHDLFLRDVPNPVEERYNLRDALWVASALNLFQRMGDRVTMANLAQLINSIGAIFTSPTGMFLQSIYFPMKLYRSQCGALAVPSHVESPSFSSKTFENVPYLDVSSTLDDAKRTLSVAVVNRHKTDPIRTTLAIRNGRPGREATAFEINGASPETENSFSEPQNVKITKKQVGEISDKVSYTFGAHSVTLIRLNLA